jgi:hypothetical protein
MEQTKENVKVLKQDKKDMEKHIAYLLAEFEAVTCLTVDAVDITRGRNGKYKVSLSVA